MTLTCTEGVRVSQGHTLYIYGQKKGTGKLTANGRDFTAGIGSNDQDDGNNDSAGTINICGGTIVAQGGDDSAGIGGGNEANGGAINIYGGTVTATGGDNGAGIGGGDEGNAGTVTIYGGKVTATGGKRCPGIGSGYDSATIGTIVIKGGEVTANGGMHGAGIGGAYGISITSGRITINGGTVAAKGGDASAGIGSGYGGNVNAEITITGGYVKANTTAVEDQGAGAGIGGGSFSVGGGDFNGTLTISGGTVLAYGGSAIFHGTQHINHLSGSAGIGGGSKGDLNGTVIISGGTVTAAGYNGGAAIGAGPRFTNSGGHCTGTVRVTGGSVKLRIVYDGYIVDDHTYWASVIGKGFDGETQGTLTLGDGCKVWLGSDAPVAASGRDAACRTNQASIWLRIAACEHSGAAYTVTGDGHTPDCPYCLDRTEKPHTFSPSTHLCTVCGYEYGGQLVTVSFNGNGGTGSMAAVQVMPHASYILPANGFTAPDGQRFKEWSVVIGDSSDPETKAPDDLIEDMTADLVVTAVWQPIPFGIPDFVLPNDLTEIGASAFEGIAATVMEIPTGCASIGDYAFRYCDGLTMIRIPADCTLGADVFDGCTKVYIYGTAGSPAESYCNSHSNCVFVEE